MRLRIHRGAAEIGGNCIEIESGSQRLVLDLGMPLAAGILALPPVSGLQVEDPELLSVVLSHPHLDHYGLLPLARSDLPVWLGEGAVRLLGAAAPFTPGAAFPQPITPYRNGERFSVGPFQVTPYLMDHSAYDAHALLVEAGGKRLFYSGDFRGHGRKAAAFEYFLANPPSDIDLLLMEGTTLGRDGDDASEGGVEEKALTLMRDTAGIVLACFSGQNIDRFVTFLRASMRSGRDFVADTYLANLITALGLASLPDMTTHDRIRIFLPKSQKRMIVHNQRFDLIDRYRSRRIFVEEIAARPAKFTMIFRGSMMSDLAGLDLAGGTLLYSLWPGYLDRDPIDLRDWARERGIAFHIVHSSGHAHRADLVRMAAAIAPRRLMPIHTQHPNQYTELFAHVQIAANGEWVVV